MEGFRSSGGYTIWTAPLCEKGTGSSMNQGWQILTDPNKERIPLRVLSETLDSGQMMATGLVMMGGNSLPSILESVLLFFVLSPGFYTTSPKDNQKTSLSRQTTTLSVVS
jgi:hypothetical protein